MLSRLVALAIVVASLGGCSLFGANEETAAIEKVAGVASAELKDGYQFAESVAIVLDRGLDADELHRTAAEVGKALRLDSTRWAVADLRIVRPDGSGDDLYVGSGSDLRETTEGLEPSLEAWIVMSQCRDLDVDLPITYDSPTPLKGDPVAIGACLDTLVAAEEIVRKGVQDRRVHLVSDGLDVAYTPQVTGEVWRSLATVWTSRSATVVGLQVDVSASQENARPVLSTGGRIVLAPEATTWNAAQDAGRMAETLDPILRTVAGLAPMQHWILRTEDKLLAAESVGLDLPPDNTTRPGDPGWNRWLKDRLQHHARSAGDLR